MDEDQDKNSFEKVSDEKRGQFPFHMGRVLLYIIVISGVVIGVLYGIGVDVTSPRKNDFLFNVLAPAFMSVLSIYLDRFLEKRVFKNKKRSPNEVSPKVGLYKPPGIRLLSFVEFFCSPETVENTCKPIVADWRAEYFEAIMQGRKWKARWISVRYVFCFLQVISLSKILSLIKNLRVTGK